MGDNLDHTYLLLNDLSDKIRSCLDNGKLQSKTNNSLLWRFFSLLQSIGEHDGTIVMQEHWALLYEALGDYNKAIIFREREISLIDRLFFIGGPVGAVDFSFLQRELRSLEKYYRIVGMYKEAHLIRNRLSCFNCES